jgi:hypothetical protein
VQNSTVIERMTHAELTRIRAAANRARRLYPGPVGEVLYRELISWEEFGYRLGGATVISRLVEHLLRAPVTISLPVHYR